MFLTPVKRKDGEIPSHASRCRNWGRTLQDVTLKKGKTQLLDRSISRKACLNAKIQRILRWSMNLLNDFYYSGGLYVPRCK